MARKQRKMNKKALDAFITKLKKLPAKEAENYTVRQAIERAAPQFISLLDRGYSYEELLTLLEENSEFKLKLVTFKQYLRNYKKAKNTQAKKRTAAKATPASTSAQTTQDTAVSSPPVEARPIQAPAPVPAATVWPSRFIEMDEENL